MFSGLKILDLTNVFAWPFASRFFGDYWADVIKIESLSWDPSRWYSPIKWNKSGYFELLNRNKKWITLDLKTSEWRNEFYKMVVSADIVIENFSPWVTKRLQIDYKTIKEYKKDIIYASLSGYWKDNPKKSYDAIIQAESWFMSLSWEDSDVKNATSIIDAFSWNSCSLAISSALYYREKTWKWQWIDVSMLWSAFHLMESEITRTSMSWLNPKKVWNHDSMIFPFWMFRTNTSPIMLCIGSDILWDNFCKIINYQDWKLYPSNVLRLENKELLINQIEDLFWKYSSKTLISMLDKANIPSSSVRTVTDVLNTKKNYDEKFLLKVQDTDLWSITVPFEYIKFEYSQMRYRPFKKY